MRTYTVLICDDSIAVHESLKCFLEKEHFCCISAFRGEEALAALQSNPIDLIILDIMLPDISGTDLCYQIRKGNNLPIIFLSAKGEEIDRIIGLELGADDYVTKPFSPREVTIRVKKLLSRLAPETNQTLLSYAELTLNPDTFEVFVKDQKIDMSAKEVKLLAYLMSNPKKVLTRESILKAIWDYDCYCDTRAVDAVVKRMRQKLPSENVHFSIQTVYGVGYRLGDFQGSKT